MALDKPLQNYLAEFGETAKQAQEIARNLGLGAVAAVWIFKNPEKAPTLLPSSLIWALLLAVLGLGLDLVQYVTKAVWLYVFYRTREEEADKERKQIRDTLLVTEENRAAADEQAKKAVEVKTMDVHAPAKMEMVTWLFFSVKMALILAAYVVLASFLSAKL